MLGRFFALRFMPSLRPKNPMIDGRFNASENLQRGNPDGFLNRAYARPDLKGGVARPLRTAVGIILGGKDFLKH